MGLSFLVTKTEFWHFQLRMELNFLYKKMGWKVDFIKNFCRTKGGVSSFEDVEDLTANESIKIYKAIERELCYG